MGSAAPAAALSASSGAPPPATGYREHVVRPGETLWRISRGYGLTPDVVARLNGIEDPTLVRVGQRLRIPGPSDGEQSTPAQPDAAPAAPAPPREGRALGVQPSEPSGGEPSEAAPGLGSSPRPEPSRQDSGAGKPATSSGSEKPSSSGAAKTRRTYPLAWPVEGKVTSRFGTRWGRHHDGIDIDADRGAPVRVAAAGEVLFAAPHGSYGNLIVVSHAGGLVTIYAHNEVNLVRKGQRVEAGQIIAKVGATGRATGPHLHFEVRRGTKPENPMRFLPP